MFRERKCLWCFVWILLAAALGTIIYFVTAPNGPQNGKPHIIIIMADDMGRNDVSYYGSNQIPTPNIDALAYNGIILDRSYTQFACTPSRAALLTGNYPIRYGMNSLPIVPGDNRSLPADAVIMPQHLKRLGYKTHLVGKWHLGAARRSDTPLERGFDTHFGYWQGFVGYFDYMATSHHPANETKVHGFDLWDGFRPMWPAQGKYATELFTQKTVEIIDKHNSEEPLFLFLAHLAAHTGKNGEDLEVPNRTATDLKFSYIKDERRRLYADIISIMDDSVGQVIKKLSDRKMLDNSIILFVSDNGPQTVGLYGNSGSSWPLRGLKLTEFEGGVRNVANVFSPLFKRRGYVNTQLFHLCDWLPTFYAAAGGNLSDLGPLDGINQWETLSNNATSQRSEILLNIDHTLNNSAIVTYGGKYKFVHGSYNDSNTNGYYGHYGEDGRGPEVPPYNLTDVLSSLAHQAIQESVQTTLKEDILQLRKDIDLAGCRESAEKYTFTCTNGCIFDLEVDPCETKNIKDELGILGEIQQRLDYFEQFVVPQADEKYYPESDPAFYNGTWCTFLDDEWCVKTPKL